MSANPYAPPNDHEEPGEDSLQRRKALWSLRVTFGILLVPALFNYLAYDTNVLQSDVAARFQDFFRLVNLAGFAVGALGIWLLGLPLVEFLGQLIRRRFAANVDEFRWNRVLYSSLNQTVFLAVPGAFLWVLWVVGFYYLKLDFHVISYAVGIPAHLLGACFYLPLFYRWYRLSRATSKVRPQD